MQIWASLRFDDHRGTSPESLVMGETGLAGILTRTKTSRQAEGGGSLLRCGRYLRELGHLVGGGGGRVEASAGDVLHA